ncbi:MAG TPA: DUF4382 domain-containing protein [Gammaproteobacteria bacterium]|nr:DUF4382 domain-containing protein [Gammaproteobacteria bacterium]
MSKQITHAAIAIPALLLLAGIVAGCGGSNPPPTPSKLNLAVTDTPVDSADKVVVAFTGVELMGPGGQTSFPFSTERTLDLLTLQGNASAMLLNGVTVTAGDYQWLRLDVDEANSYVISSTGGKFPLNVPSGSESGLKLVSGFTVAQGNTADFVIDFDLRHSLTLDNKGGTTTYTLKPVLRLIDMQQVGSVTGTVAASLSIGGTLITATTCSPAVYVYNGTGVVPEGYNVTVTGGTAPLTSATVSLNTTSGAYDYTVGFLAPGTYTLAATCAAMDTTGATTLAFSTSQTAVVTANTATTINF